MESDLKRFLDSIKLDKSFYDSLEDASIEKVYFHRDKKNYEVIIKNDTILPFNTCKALKEASKNKINGKDDVVINYIYKVLDSNDILNFMKSLFTELKSLKPSLSSITNDDITISDEIITIYVSNKSEEDSLKKEVKSLLKELSSYGLYDLEINISISEEKREEIKKELQEARTTSKGVEVAEKELSKVLTGREIKEELPVITLNDIMGEERNVVVEAFIFGKEEVERENINIITLKISDKTNSLLAKVFKKDKDEYKAINKRLQVGSWYKIQGSVENDKFSHDLVLGVRNMEEIPSKDEKVVDDAEEKRIELHSHTMMSAMDGVCDATSLVKYAAKIGMDGIAITDHNGCQSYPDLYHAVQKLNKSRKDNPFKVLYGVEMNVVNDDIDIIYQNRKYDLLQDEFVVFDTETTGFYAGSDQMIEIGAVKIRNGEIIDRFDELINPGKPLRQTIIDLTMITDEMLKDCDTEENVTKRFLEWAGNDPMVAHNAKFDISFMRAACSKYNLGEFDRTVLDTMSIARMLYPTWPNHKLSTLVKKLEVPWDEDKHHRGDYDAEGTAIAFYKMCKTMYDRNIVTTNDILEDIDIASIIRFERPFHMTMIAIDKDGLKNLFKIISIANTKYLYKNEQPKIPRSEVAKLRSGLLLGSACINGEIFDKAGSKTDEELVNMMNFYDYIEVQPTEVFSHIIRDGEKFNDTYEAEEYIRRIVRVAKEAGKPVVATGDVHNITKDDLIYRKIIVNTKFNGKMHPLCRKGVEIPNMYLRTTKEMLDAFSFLGEDLAKEIVVTNTQEIASRCKNIDVIVDTPKPFAPKIPKSIETMTDLVYTKANSMYGDPMPYLIEARLCEEMYGNNIKDAVKYNLGDNYTDEEFYKIIHETIKGGYDKVKNYMKDYLKKIDEEGKTDEVLEQEARSKLGGIIGAGFDVIYLIAQKLVKHSNDEGYLVGSRGSVGSSLVAYMMGITEVNSLPAHYRCPKCLKSIFDGEDGSPLGATYSSGFDLPDYKCPECGISMAKDGQDIPFATFLGFNADKVPDIDLNFSELNQASAHNYTKVLFGVDNVYRAGTIGTVAEKTAFGYVKGYCENNNIVMRNVEIERIAQGCTGVKRTTGQHPGGIVVIPRYMDVFDFTPFQFPADDPTATWRTTHFDYHAIDADVLKLDILGHTDPTQLRMITNITGDDVTKVPLDDKETMSIFTSPKALGVTAEQIMCETGTLGIPEFGTPFTISLVKETKPTTFAELIKISGLSHGTDVWLGNAEELIKNNVVPFKDVIGCRDDIMVDLMYKGLPPIKAFKIMEFVRKGRPSNPKGPDDPAEWNGYIDLMRQYKVEDWFIDSCNKIKYMFPKAHATAYVTSAFRIAWYKVHKPLVYYATYFSTRFDDFDINVMTKGYDAIKQKMSEIQSKGYDATNKESSLLETLKLALEATARGIKFKTLDIEKSDGHDFVMDERDNSLIMPFRSLDGLGDTVADKIIEERKVKPFYSIEDFQTRGKVSQSLVDVMRTMGIFGDLPESSQLSLF